MANIIITNLSIIKDGAKELKYDSDIGVQTGTNTNDAPVKYLIEKIKASKGSVDGILAVTTPQAEPAFAAFKEMLSEEFGGSIPSPEMIETNETEEIIADTVKKIVGRFDPGDCAYIDTTGGFRNSSYLLMCVVRMLEYSGIALEKAVYSKLNEKRDGGKIKDVTELYNMYDLINAVDAFTNYGNSHGLEEYFSSTDEQEIKDVIGAMNKFSDMVSLCSTSELSDVLNELNTSLNALSDAETESSDIILFKSLIPTVRDKFYMKENGIEYPDIVRWCLDNRLIQQAVTIYVERMPEYFFTNGYFTVSKEMLEKVKNEKVNSHFDLYYELFYNTLLVTEKGSPFQNLLAALVKECPKEYEYNKNNIFHWIFKKLQTGSDAEKILAAVPDDIVDKNEIKEPLKEFVRLRKAIYEGDEKREKGEYLYNLSYSPELKESIRKREATLAKKPEGFIRTIANDNEFCQLLSGSKPAKYSDNKLSFIESLPVGIKNREFALGEGITPDKMQEILRDIIYAKTFIRNKLNHASDEDSVKEEMQTYFEHCGYNVSGDLTVDGIKEFMTKAIENITI